MQTSVPSLTQSHSSGPNAHMLTWPQMRNWVVPGFGQSNFLLEFPDLYTVDRGFLVVRKLTNRSLGKDRRITIVIQGQSLSRGQDG